MEMRRNKDSQLNRSEFANTRRRVNGAARGSFEKTSPSIRDPNHAEIFVKVEFLHPSENPQCERGNIGRTSSYRLDMGIVVRSVARRDAVRFDLRSNLMPTVASIAREEEKKLSLDG